MEQGKVAGFLKNVMDAEKLNGLAEDIRDATMDYQVRSPTPPVRIMSDIVPRPHCSKIFMTRVAGSS